MGWPIVGKIAAAGLGALGAYKSAKAMRGANDLDLQKLRREAEQNGFNPLTVLRATGGQGSTKGPSGNLASGAFFQTFAQGIPSILEANYNKKMKDAQLTNLNASTKSLLSNIQNDPYIGFNDTDNKVPVKYLNKEFEIPLSMARHMKVLPNQSLNAGLMAEIFGEVSEVTNAFSLGGQQNTFGIDFLGFGPNQGKSIFESHPYVIGYNKANDLFDDAISVLKKNVNQPSKLSSLAADNRVNFVNKLGGALSSVGDFFTRNQGIPIEDALSPDTIPNWYNRRK